MSRTPSNSPYKGGESRTPSNSPYKGERVGQLV